jgi:Flp pilus assembly pilin Flp
MSSFLARFARDESAAPAVEYALIAALIVLAILVGAGGGAGEIARLFDLLGA